MSELIDLFAGLNSEQAEAVSSTEGYYRIIAGAGSGKTRTLTNRFAYLVRELGVPPQNILCVTFTNKAAAEMKSRIKKLLGGEVDAALITTYHGFCVKVLKEDIHRLFFPSNFKILDSRVQKNIIEEIYAGYDIKLDYATFEETLSYISREKANGKYIEMMVDPAYSFSADNAFSLEEKIYTKYLEHQKKIYGLDFSDLLYFAIYLFEHNDDILEKWKTRLHYIQVDEFQDTSKRELDIINMLCSGNNNLFVVGDPDQNIYEWRSSDNRFLVNFEKNYPNVRTIFLTQNYRSTPEILNVGNCLIAKNINRVPKDLFTENPNGAIVEHAHFKDDEEESKWLVEKIRAIAKQNNDTYNDIAVLYRSSFLSRWVEQTLYYADIPYIIHGGVKFFDRMEIRDSIAFLKLINDTSDDEAFLRIVNTPKRQIGKTRIDYLKNVQKEILAMNQNKMPLFDILKEVRSENFFTGTGAVEFVEIIDHFKQQVTEGMKVSEILNGVLDRTGYKAYISRSGDMERFDNVTELLASISEFEMSAGEDVSLSAYIQQLAVVSDYESERVKNCVKLMTIHSAKGLEFPYVIIAGMNDGIFPSKRTLEDRQLDGLEEERRLCYVAVTRAMRELYFIESENGAMKQLPSRFLYEIDENHIKRIGKVPDDLTKKVAQKSAQIGAQVNPPKKSLGFKIADFVKHKVFGIGKITSEDNSSYYIKFDSSANPKPIAKSYTGLSPVGENGESINENDSNANNNPNDIINTVLDADIPTQSESTITTTTVGDAPPRVSQNGSDGNNGDVPPTHQLTKPEPQIVIEPASTKRNFSNEAEAPQPPSVSNFNRKIDRLFKKPQREPETDDIPPEAEIIEDNANDISQNDNVTAPIKLKIMPKQEDIADQNTLASSEDESQSEIEEFSEELDRLEELEEAEEEVTSSAPVSLYNAPPQILFDNEDRVNLWDDPNVPKNGWICTDVIDLGAPFGECGMCGKEDIRYVHIMLHERHQSIGTGCVCAGKMEGDINASKERENMLKNKIGRYTTFTKLDLKISKKGNPYTKYKDTVITFMERENKDKEPTWAFVENGEFSNNYKSLEEAKRAAFEKVDTRRKG